jgi:hypothetical protein
VRGEARVRPWGGGPSNEGELVNKKHWTAFVAVGVVAAASLTACGSDDDPTPGSGVDTTIVSGGTDTTTFTTDMSSVPSTSGG